MLASIPGTLSETVESDARSTQDLLRQARILSSFAEVALYPRPGSPVGTPATALILLRQALHLALAALEGCPSCEDSPIEKLFVTASTQSIVTDAASEVHVSLSDIERSLIQSDPSRIAQRSKFAAVTEARSSLRFVKRLLVALPDEDGELLKHRRRTTAIAVLAGLALMALGMLGWTFAIRLIHGPDLLGGLSFTTSSVYDDFSAKDHTSHGRPTAILFHTREDDQPWVEYDLGTARTIHRVEVRNRTDCCEDRANPLVLEGSLNHRDYRELAKQPDQFTEWTANFDKTEARYVRLRVTRKSILHLERIVIR